MRPATGSLAPEATATICALGGDAPDTCANVATTLDSSIVGGGDTTSDTATACGLLPAGEALMDTVAEYAPTAKLALLTESCSDAGDPAAALDADKEASSQPVGWPLPYVTDATDRFWSVPGPALETAIDCAAGLAPPWRAEKLAVALASEIDGGG